MSFTNIGLSFLLIFTTNHRWVPKYSQTQINDSIGFKSIVFSALL